MTLKQGIIYKTRSGQTLPPLKKVINGTAYCFETKIGPYFYNWKENGIYLTPLAPHPMDIIKDSQD